MSLNASNIEPGTAPQAPGLPPAPGPLPCLDAPPPALWSSWKLFPRCLLPPIHPAQPVSPPPGPRVSPLIRDPQEPFSCCLSPHNTGICPKPRKSREDYVGFPLTPSRVPSCQVTGQAEGRAPACTSTLPATPDPQAGNLGWGSRC